LACAKTHCLCLKLTKSVASSTQLRCKAGRQSELALLKPAGLNSAQFNVWRPRAPAAQVFRRREGIGKQQRNSCLAEFWRPRASAAQVSRHREGVDRAPRMNGLFVMHEGCWYEVLDSCPVDFWRSRAPAAQVSRHREGVVKPQRNSCLAAFG